MQLFLHGQNIFHNFSFHDAGLSLPFPHLKLLAGPMIEEVVLNTCVDGLRQCAKYSDAANTEAQLFHQLMLSLKSDRSEKKY